MISIAVSDLDSWREYVDGPPFDEMPEMTKDQLVARLRRQVPASPEMNIGTSFHAILSKAVECELEHVEQDGLEFFFEVDHAISLPRRTESKIQKIYQTPIGPVLLKGRVDAIDGNLITDYKLTFGAFDGERYADSMQWRAYLDMTGLSCFRHLVFSANQPSKRKHQVWIYDVHQFDQYAYDGMHADVAYQVVGLAEFVANYLPEKVA